MNRIAPFALSFALAFASVGCSVDTATSSDLGGHSSQHDEAGDDEGDEAKGAAPASTKQATDESASLPAPKLLPQGAVKTVNACTATNATNITLGSGNITRTTRDVKGFHGVGIRGAATMVLTEGSGFGVQVETDDNLQDIVTTTLSQNGNLVVESTASYCTNGGVRVLVTMPKFDNVAIDGSGTIDATKLTAASDLKLLVLGSGSISFDGHAAALTVDIEGSGTISLKSGSAKTTKALVTGSGIVTAKDFEAGAVTKQVDGSGVISL